MINLELNSRLAYHNKANLYKFQIGTKVIPITFCSLHVLILTPNWANAGKFLQRCASPLSLYFIKCLGGGDSPTSWADTVAN